MKDKIDIMDVEELDSTLANLMQQIMELEDRVEKLELSNKKGQA